MIATLALAALALVGTDRKPQETRGNLVAGSPVAVRFPAVPTDRTVSLVIALDRPDRLDPGAIVATSVVVPGGALNKPLHLGDPDVTWLVRQPGGAEVQVTLQTDRPGGAPLPFTVRAVDVADPASVPGDDGVSFEAEPNDRHDQANELVLGRTVYGLADDRSYLPWGDTPTEAEAAPAPDWFHFDFPHDTPKLAFFALDFVDRDVPPDVRVYQVQDGKLVEYTQGIDPQSLQRERPPRPGANKFTTRVLTRGRYYVLVDACQPEYQLRTKLFDVPPYLAPADADRAEPRAIADAADKAVRAAIDFQLLAGDSWHANTPRKGHPTDRVANAHQETSTCLGCHATHFTTQSALAAVRAGYRVEQPETLRFLTDRLANNPTPFHGHPDALWARMIPAPANVMGRLSTILMDYEDRVAGAPRDRTHQGIGAFLKLYYDGRTALPPDESNGNNPVSRYKVATDAWRQLDTLARRTGDAQYASTRDLVARLLPTGEPTNTRDLAAQTIGLCLVDRAGLADRINANVARLLSLQHHDGHWPIKFDAGSPGAEMQTGESLYALALAGLTADHPAVRRGAVALLTRQKPFGGWLDLGPYEQFQTPFRETQWSLMALSRLYPAANPARSGWNGPRGPQPTALRDDSASHLIADLERIWDTPDRALQLAVTEHLNHADPMVRYAACCALSRVGDADAVAPLVVCLGDGSKVVQRAAAEALRSVGNRATASANGPDPAPLVAALISAIGSDDDRTRRGASRIFAAHFRDLSRETKLADALLGRLDDTDPVVSMQAIKGLWRWWYWQSDLGLRGRIEDALIAHLASPTHPWVRRNLIEALYIVGDENIRYLDKNWIPALATEDRRTRATASQHATANRLGDKFAAVLTGGGSALQREGVLRAMSEFHERPVLGGRIGNDLEPMLFYDEAVPRLASALTGQLADANPTIRRLALQALVTLRGTKDPALARAVLAARGDFDPATREWAATMAKEFPIAARADVTDPELARVLETLLRNPLPESQATALGVIEKRAPARGKPAADPTWLEAIRSRIGADAADVRASALRAVAAYPSLLTEKPVRDLVAKALADGDVEARVAAIRLALGHAGLVSDSALRKALEDDAPAHRIGLLGVLAASKARTTDLRLIGPVSNALVEEDRGVREKALQAIQTHPDLVANPAVAEALRDLARSDNPRHAEMATALLRTLGRSSANGSDTDQLNLAYFEIKVLPILNASAEDGQSCIGCHRSHSILKLVPPGEGGRWTPDAVRANYRASLRVVNPAEPRQSLLLGKPTWEAAEEAEAQNDPTRKAHAGGVRFDADSSPEYQTILDWINGARLKP